MSHAMKNTNRFNYSATGLRTWHGKSRIRIPQVLLTQNIRVCKQSWTGEKYLSYYVLLYIFFWIELGRSVAARPFRPVVRDELN